MAWQAWVKNKKERKKKVTVCDGGEILPPPSELYFNWAKTGDGQDASDSVQRGPGLWFFAPFPTAAADVLHGFDAPSFRVVFKKV